MQLFVFTPYPTGTHMHGAVLIAAPDMDAARADFEREMADPGLRHVITEAQPPETDAPIAYWRIEAIFDLAPSETRRVVVSNWDEG